tara:strand:+ start:197 stop:472 length:276 start_codon:yes stop_codon:yes gene_type:complete
MKNKNWTVDDDIYVINEVMNKYKTCEWGELIKTISKEIGTTQSSVKMRIKNYVSILTSGERGLDNYADDSMIAIQKSLSNFTKNQLLRAFE